LELQCDEPAATEPLQPILRNQKNALNPGDYKGSPPLSHFLAHRFLRRRENRLAYHFRLAIQT